VKENWISVDDKLPLKEGTYLVHAPSQDPDRPLIGVDWWDGKWSLLPDVWLEAITHWQPLEPPNG